MSDIRPLWAIVTPVFEDGESFARLCERLGALQGRTRFFMVAVDDGSLGAPPNVEDISRAGLTGEVLRLARNVGHQAAIAIGLNHCAERADLAGVIVMDSDGEDAPEAVPLLIAACAAPDIDVVVAERAKRSETLSFRAFYVVYRYVFLALTGQVIRFGNFMALKPHAVRRMAAMHETWTHLAASVVKSRLRRAAAPTDRATRFAGQSRMNFVSLVLHGMRAVMVFADAVLTRLTLLCVIMASVSAVSVVTALMMKILGFATAGWVTTVTGFSLSIFIQIGALTMITLIINGLTRSESPVRLAATARETVARIDRTGA